MKRTTAVLSAVTLLLLLEASPAQYSKHIPINILVSNSYHESPNKTYCTHVVERGILLGAMKRLNASDQDFTFTYIEDPNFGPFLTSVNGLFGNSAMATFWELKVQKVNGEIITPDVGIGCYIPSENDLVILNYKKYQPYHN